MQKYTNLNNNKVETMTNTELYLRYMRYNNIIEWYIQVYILNQKSKLQSHRRRVHVRLYVEVVEPNLDPVCVCVCACMIL